MQRAAETLSYPARGVRMRFLRRPLFWVGLLISLGALFLAFRGLRVNEVADALAGANYFLVAASLAVQLLVIYLKGIRWSLLFRPLPAPRLGTLIGTMNLGYLVNNVLPLRVGELVRAYVAGEVEGIRKTRVLVTVGAERLLDTLTVVAFLAILLPFVDVPQWAARPAFILGLALVLVTLILVAVARRRDRAGALLGWGMRVVPERFRERALGIGETLLDGLSIFARPWLGLLLVGWSVVIWLLAVLFHYLVMLAFDLDVPFSAAIFVMAATALGMVIPSSPGYIGVFHAITIESLVGVFGVGRSDAQSYALVQHASSYVLTTALGLGYIWRAGLSWGAVRVSMASAPAVGEATVGPADAEQPLLE